MASAIAGRFYSFGSRFQNAVQHLPKLCAHSLAQYEHISGPIRRSDPEVHESWPNLSAKVNSQLKDNTAGRLFAVVMAAGKQRKITQEDIIIFDNNDMPVEIGDKIFLNKVLLIGGSDFTIVGRPMLKPSIAQVEATVIEKTTSHPKICFWYHKRKRYRFFKLRKDQLTYLRITGIKFFGLTDAEHQEQLS